MWTTLSNSDGIFGVLGCLAVAVLGLRILLVAVVALWSLKADDAGRSHALALIRTIATTFRVTRRPSGRTGQRPRPGG